MRTLVFLTFFLVLMGNSCAASFCNTPPSPTTPPSAATLPATTFFIAPNGNDSWTGLLATPNANQSDGPLVSLQGAQAAIRNLSPTQRNAGPIMVEIAGGTYAMRSPLTLYAADSGSPTAPIIYRARAGESPVFDGGKAITGFTKTASGLWTAQIPDVAAGTWYFEQLFVNGKRATRARTPDTGYFYIQDIREVVITPGDVVAIDAWRFVKTDPLVMNELTGLNAPQLRDVQLIAFHNWNITRRFIEFLDPVNNEIAMRGYGNLPWNPLRINYRFYLENYAGAVTAPGEWFLDRSGRLTYHPRLGETIQTAEVIAPVASRFIVANGNPFAGKFVDHIQFQGLTFRHAAYNMPPGGFEPGQAASSIDAVIMLDGARNVQFSDCTIEHIGRYGIWFRKGCRDCTVQRTCINDMGAGGIRIGTETIPWFPDDVTRGIIADNNIIRAGGKTFTTAVGIWIGQSGSNRVSHNDIGDLYYTGVSVGWQWDYSPNVSDNNLIEFNNIHDLGQGVLSDMGGVYTLGQSLGTRVRNNVISNVSSYSYGGWGLYNDQGSTGILMENNLVYDTKSGGYNINFGRDNIIRNNILAYAKNQQLMCNIAEPHRSFTFTNNIVIWDTGMLLVGSWPTINISMDNNLYWNPIRSNFGFAGMPWSRWKQIGRDMNSIITDPGFADPSNRDFHLSPTSPALSVGFQPFDDTLAGVYGSAKWITKAQRPINPAICAADLNSDSIVDNGDIAAFVLLFIAQDLAVDFTGDGIIDNGDIGAFVTAFLAGC